MKKEGKAQVIQSFGDKLKNGPDLFLADFSGIRVEEITTLRVRFRQAGMGFKVMKNTLMRRAFEGSTYAELDSYLEGPNAVIICPNDPVEMAKIIQAYNKEFQERPLKVKAGVLGGRLTDGSKVGELATLPPREVLLARALAGMQAPVSGLVNVLAGTIRQFMNVVVAIKDQKAGQA